MFRPVTKKTPFATTMALLELIFHASIRNIRKSSGNAVLGLVMNIIQSLVMVGVMIAMFNLLGMRGSAVRGDFTLYIMSGVFNFATHSKSLMAVSKSDGPTSAMMQHSPMNTIVAICSSALSALYLQTLSAFCILFFYHTLMNRITIYDPVGVFGMFLLAWASGIGVGMIFKAATPWQPEAFGIVTTLYARANMIFSGKMFLGNSLSERMLYMYSWNPLFHCIDQTRGFMFENYSPRNSSLEYPLVMTFVLIVIGLMAENFTKKHASLSWGARR